MGWLRSLFGGSTSDPRAERGAQREAILRLKDIHRGQRAFLIGNGPSMRPEYFDALKGEITFGFNGICRLFATTAWRPTYFMIHDQIVAEQLGDELTRHTDVRCLVGTGLKERFKGHPDVTYYTLPYGPPGDGAPPFRTDLENGLQGGWTVAYCGLQMAWYMGIREVYLLGVDIAYQVDVERVVGDYFAVKVVEGDFRKAYFDERLSPKAGAQSTLPDTDGMLRALQAAKEHYEGHGGSIRNAAPDSPLTLFPRSDILSGPGKTPGK